MRPDLNHGMWLPTMYRYVLYYGRFLSVPFPLYHYDQLDFWIFPVNCMPDIDENNNRGKNNMNMTVVGKILHVITFVYLSCIKFR